MFGLPYPVLFVGVLGIAFVGIITFSVATGRESNTEDMVAWEDVPDVVDIEPPDVSTTTFGIMEDFLRYRRYRSKLRKFAQKGYVGWRIVGDSISRLKFVKPSDEGGGIPELEYGGEIYLFPRDAGVPSERNGMWVYTHREGEPDPVNLRDSLTPSMSSKALKEYLTMRVSSSPPSLMDGLSFLDSDNLMTYAIAAVILIAGVYGTLHGVF